MPAFERATIAGTAAAILLLFLFPPFMSIDAASGGRVHASLGYHPVWNPPSAEAAFRVLYPDTLGVPTPARLTEVAPRINRVRLSFSAVAVAGVCVLVVEGRRRLTRARPAAAVR
jgi:hypothetical protein